MFIIFIVTLSFESMAEPAQRPGELTAASLGAQPRSKSEERERIGS